MGKQRWREAQEVQLAVAGGGEFGRHGSRSTVVAGSTSVVAM